MDGDSSSLEILDARQSSLQDLDEIIARFEATFPKTELHVFLLDDSDHELRQVAGVSHNLQSDLPDKAMERVLHNGTVLLLDESGQRLEPAAPDVSKVSDAFVPVKARGGTAGVLLARCAGATFSTHCLTYLQTVASYVGIALHARQLVDHAWQRTAEIETVYGVTETARSLKPLYPTLVEIHAHVTRAFDVPSFYVALYDTDAGTITFPYAVDNGEEVRLEPIPVEQQDSLVAWVIRHRRPYATGNWPEERPVPGLLVSGSTPRSILCYPLQVDGDLVGALSLQSDEAQAFDEHEANILASIADQVAVVVHNSRVYSKSQKLVDNMAQEYLAAAAMRQAVSAMGTSLDADEVLDRLLAAVGDMVEIDSASVVLVHGETLEFHKHLAYDGTGEEELLQSANRQLQQAPLLKRVALQREPLVIDDVRDEESWIPVEGLDYVRSFAAVPMIAANEVIGILTLDAARPGVYGQREIWLITTLTSHASLAFQNARLHAELQSRVRELTTLYEASAAISADLDRDSVLRTVVGEMVRALDVDACLILVPQGLSGLRVAIDHNAPDSDVTASAAPDAGREQLVGTVEAHPTVRGTFEDGELVSLNAHEALSEQEQSLLQQLRLSSVLLVPLVQADRMGVLLLGRQELARPFLERDVRLSRNLAAQAAAAIEHAHLYTQAQRRIDELSTFHQIVLQLNTPLEIEVVLQNITEAALRLIEANNLHIYLWDAESDEFTFCSALWRNGSREPAVASPRKDGLTASVVHGGEAVVIDNANGHPFYRDPEASKWGVQAIAGFPLQHGGRVIGAFTVTYVEPHLFTPDERMLMSLLADQAAVAVENARLFSDAQQRLRSMSALVDMAKQVTGNLRVELVLQTTVQTLQKLLRARASTIALLSDDEQELIVEAAAGIKPQFHRVRIRLGEGISGRAVSERRMIYIRDTYREPDFLFFDDVLRSLLVVPLITRSKVIGTLTVDSDRPEAFSESDTQLLTIAAAQVSVAIANARLFEALEERAAELAVAYDELKENDRLKDELVQNVSHELRTPLTFIRGYVDLLIDGEMGELSPEQKRALQIVADKTGEVTRLVDDIMSLQRIDSANLMRQRFSMASLLESAVDLHKLSASKRGLAIVFQQPASQGIVEADRGRVTQILDNLIGNAMKFSPDGGVIELRMVERKKDVLVVVSDEGIGVAQDKVGRIFDRFYQIDGSSRRRFGGAGIGLAIVKRIVDAHEGDIWVKSELGVGSSFYFTIPKSTVSDRLRASATTVSH